MYKIQAIVARWRLMAGIALVLLAGGIISQPLLRASDDGFDTATVRSEISDQAMFGKKLISMKLDPGLDEFQAQLQPGSGPVAPTRLRIPAIGIDTYIEEVGLRFGQMDVPTNIWNAGWLSSGPRPGATGNAVLAGHKDSVSGLAVFYDLDQLKAGDRVYVSDRYGYELTFEIYETDSYNVDEVPLSQLFGQTDEKHLNLITCDGNFVKKQASYNKRLVIYSRLIN